MLISTPEHKKIFMYMKKFMIFLATAAVPFLLVWMGFILTGFSYNPRHVFQTECFWGMSVIYWLLWVCLSPMIMEVINEVNKPAK